MTGMIRMELGGVGKIYFEVYLTQSVLRVVWQKSVNLSATITYIKNE